MPDMIPAVGAEINPPNPQQSLGLLSAILGLKQQQLGLQTGQANLQTAQATALSSQIGAQGQQEASQFFKDWDPTQHVDDDGTVDLGSAFASPDFKNAGPGKTAIIDNLIKIKQGQLQNKQSLAQLNGTVLGQMTTQLGALAKDKDVIEDSTDPDTGVNAGRAKADNYLDNFSKLGPDAARIAGIYKPLIDKIPQGQLAKSIGQIQMLGQSASEQQAAQFPKPTAVQAGAKTQLYNVSPSEGFTPGQQPVTSTDYVTPPANVPGPGGNYVHVGAGGAGLPNAGGGGPAASPSKLQPLQQPAPNAPRAAWDNYNSQVQGASQLLTSARTAANDPMNGVQPTRFRNQAIMDLIPHADTGPGLRLLNTLASRLPGSTGDAYQDLEHYTAQNSAALAQKMGVPNTNLGAETAAAAAGNVERNPGALAEITRTNDALNTAFDLYNRGLQKVSNNGSDPSRVAAYQQAFGQNLDVNAVRWADAHRRGDTDEIAALTKKLGPQGVAAAQQKLRVLGALAGTGDLP